MGCKAKGKRQKAKGKRQKQNAKTKRDVPLEPLRERNQINQSVNPMVGSAIKRERNQINHCDPLPTLHQQLL
ncbi:hypothetical protein [Moorena sp. SIO3H5]|uniref:hypothetical protein n=1 Tax=Moorena sp. SIO3H5 TaxID=2607834 RepID=UPI0013B5F273|nr:hypothetical protein [Moorena sp. SIO3H5]NEO69757.1 hypothetical protein [Moorena sp. SIO3H5]